MDVPLEELRKRPLYKDGLSFNPYCSGCTAGRLLTDRISDLHEGFNPYCSGCTAGSLNSVLLHENSCSFNPYCSGCTAGSELEHYNDMIQSKFQSLL